MATYVEIQAYVKSKYGFVPKTCWIAHAKEICGIPVKEAPNRLDLDTRANPCPRDKLFAIKEAFRYFGMI
jgi:hypothetical protein